MRVWFKLALQQSFDKTLTNAEYVETFWSSWFCYGIGSIGIYSNENLLATENVG